MKSAPLNCAVIAAALLATPAHARTSSTAAEMLPTRSLHCTLGRALNLDPSKSQTVADIKYEGAHQFSLVLPARPKHAGPPPEPTADPEPVTPGTRISVDPSALAADFTGPFYRVIDLWPVRVELVGRISPELSRLIIISDIDTDKRTANLFMTRAADAASMDLNAVYQGGCRIESSRSENRRAAQAGVRKRGRS